MLHTNGLNSSLRSRISQHNRYQWNQLFKKAQLEQFNKHIQQFSDLTVLLLLSLLHFCSSSPFLLIYVFILHKLPSLHICVLLFYKSINECGGGGKKTTFVLGLTAKLENLFIHSAIYPRPWVEVQKHQKLIFKRSKLACIQEAEERKRVNQALRSLATFQHVQNLKQVSQKL